MRDNKSNGGASLQTSLGDAAAWRADLRAGGVERRPPPSNKPEPDRQHVDGRQHAPPRRVVMVAPDKPPQPAPPPPPPPPPAPPPPAPESSPRTFYSPEFRADVVADFYSCRRAERHLTQRQYAERIGVEEHTLSRWLVDDREEKRRQQAAERRKRSRDESASRARSSSAPERSFEAVSVELAEAIADAERCNQRVRELKGELRDLLDEDA